jgi:hypothetical protein
MPVRIMSTVNSYRFPYSYRKGKPAAYAELLRAPSFADLW